MKTIHMKIKYALFFLAINVSFSVIGQNVDVARKYIEMEQYKKAQKLLLKLTGENPNDSWANFYLAEVYLEKGKADSADIYIQKAIVDSKNMMAVAAQGRLALRRGDLAKAQELFDKAWKGDKKNGNVYAYISDAYIKEKGDTASASKILAIGRERTPKSAALYIAEAKIWKIRKEIGMEADCYEKRALFYDKQSAISYVNLGWIIRYTKNYEDAIVIINKALAIDSLYIPAYKALGECNYWWKGHEGDASKAYRKYLALAGEDASLDDKNRYAFTLFKNQEYDEATKVMNELSAINPNDYIILRLKAYMAYSMKDYTKGFEFANKFFEVQKDPTFYLSDDFENLAKLQVENKMDSAAAESYVKAFAIDTLGGKNLDNAVKNMEEAAKINYLRLKKYPAAIKNYSELTRLKPGVPLYFLNLGRSYVYSVSRTDTAAADSLRRKAIWKNADSAFAKVIELIPKRSEGHIWRANAAKILDPEATNGFAKPYCDSLLNFLKVNNVEDKKPYISSYQYLAFLYMNKAFTLKRLNNAAEYEVAKAAALDYSQKLGEVDPGNQYATKIPAELKNLDARAAAAAAAQRKPKASTEKKEDAGIPSN
jgi:tetratricopeptide (TPR) repeat protein